MSVVKWCTSWVRLVAPFSLALYSFYLKIIFNEKIREALLYLTHYWSKVRKAEVYVNQATKALGCDQGLKTILIALRHCASTQRAQSAHFKLGSLTEVSEISPRQKPLGHSPSLCRVLELLPPHSICGPTWNCQV